MESRTQGSRPRTQKKSEAKDSLSEDRHSRGQGQECSRPRPRTKDTKRKCSPKKKKKRSSQKFFRRSPLKNVFQKIFQALHKILTFQKSCCPRAEDRPIFEDLRPRGQGQGLQNVSSRTPPLITIITTHRNMAEEIFLKDVYAEVKEMSNQLHLELIIPQQPRCNATRQTLRNQCSGIFLKAVYILCLDFIP